MACMSSGLEGLEGTDGRELGGLLGDIVVGDIDIRSMISFNRSRSLSAWPPALFCLSRSICASNWAPSERRLLTNVSTFFSRLSTVSFISE